jgi:hypothetical protein
MKHFILSLFTLTLMTSFAQAGETTTECPMMREQTERSNPKANLATAKPKPRSVRGASAQ